MTVQATQAGSGEERALDEPAAVRFTPTGAPLALRWRGTIWQAVGNPVRWSTATGRSTDRAGARARGTASCAWRFTAQTGPASPVLEFGIAFDERRDEWRLLSVAGTSG